MAEGQKTEILKILKRGFKIFIVNKVLPIWSKFWSQVSVSGFSTQALTTKLLEPKK